MIHKDLGERLAFLIEKDLELYVYLRGKPDENGHLWVDDMHRIVGGMPMVVRLGPITSAAGVPESPSGVKMSAL